MKDIMEYKNYYGSVHFNVEDMVFYGKIEFIRALITYEATDATNLKQSFEDAVDNYLEMCELKGITPESPFKGSLNIRLGSDLHRRVAIAAEERHLSINKFIAQALQETLAGDY